MVESGSVHLGDSTRKSSHEGEGHFIIIVCEIALLQCVSFFPFE